AAASAGHLRARAVFLERKRSKSARGSHLTIAQLVLVPPDPHGRPRHILLQCQHAVARQFTWREPDDPLCHVRPRSCPQTPNGTSKLASAGSGWRCMSRTKALSAATSPRAPMAMANATYKVSYVE